MRGSDELLTLAELAIGLAGFSGVVAAFAYRGRLEALDRVRFIALFTSAIGSAVFAFVPLLFHHAGFDEASTWRASSLLFFLAAVAFTAVIGRPLRRTALTSGAAIPPWLIAWMFALAILNYALQLSNALGWPYPPSPLPFLAGLVICVYYAASFFAFLVLFRPNEPGE
jgi:hypothetical protein